MAKIESSQDPKALNYFGLHKPEYYGRKTHMVCSKRFCISLYYIGNNANRRNQDWLAVCRLNGVNVAAHYFNGAYVAKDTAIRECLHMAIALTPSIKTYEGIK